MRLASQYKMEVVTDLGPSVCPAMRRTVSCDEETSTGGTRVEAHTHTLATHQRQSSQLFSVSRDVLPPVCLTFGFACVTLCTCSGQWYYKQVKVMMMFTG